MIESYVWRIDEVVESISDFGVNFNKVSVSLKRIDEIVNNRLYDDESFGTKELKKAKGYIEFKDVKFKYREDEDYTLKGLNLVIKPNKKTAIVGRSGNGKSTIFNLLLRYFDASIGEILVDGINIKELSEKSLRSNISIIRQSPFLFNVSILDNFKYVKKNVTLKEVREVCKKAYIDDYIMSLPEGYNTIIGEGGVNLSGGQKQRIAIARTLLLNTKIILFDEATSALDNESQEYIKKTIDSLVKDHTIIIVAHRLSTIVDADVINVIDKGKLAAQGTHKELLNSSTVYNKLYTNESSNS
jgi:ATP-binding cassette subfamily B protein